MLLKQPLGFPGAATPFFEGNERPSSLSLSLAVFCRGQTYRTLWVPGSPGRTASPTSAPPTLTFGTTAALVRRSRGSTATVSDLSGANRHCLIVAPARITAVSALARSGP